MVFEALLGAFWNVKNIWVGAHILLPQNTPTRVPLQPTLPTHYTLHLSDDISKTKDQFARGSYAPLGRYCNNSRHLRREAR